MRVSITTILSCQSIEELRLLDTYLELKKTLEEQLGFKLCIRGWVSFFNRIKSLKMVVLIKRNKLEKISDIQSFTDAKRQASHILGFKVNAKERSELQEMLRSLISTFSKSVISPYERFESTKRRNFIHSSRLEGLEISPQSSEQSLESIVAKFKVEHG